MQFEMECMECSHQFKSDSSEPVCPECGSLDIDMIVRVDIVTVINQLPVKTAGKHWSKA